ncbi:ergothioneine biosynthesis protein EgtB [Lunatibacter salilacus]|uniref:ergothioneine biosynthesis protein EgtB n=1 Tax=Lunatibacter salilacus TaxID=2483804 RepID=UPI00131ABB6F|nr:ergothioneine biosynthesis protein EgtB [Lunatibacter salilacus]
MPDQQLINKINNTRINSENICLPLEIEDYIPQPIPDVSPPKWHLGHTTWFFEAFVLVPYLNGYSLFHEDFAYLFNSYYNNAGKRVLRPNRGLMSRPPVREVMAYRAYVTDNLLKLVDQDPGEKVRKIIELGINHEEQHQELLVYDIKFILGNQPTFPIYGDRFELSATSDKLVNEDLSKGIYTIGASGDTFCYDNECRQHQVYLDAFQIANRLVTNGEYMTFISDGGYADFNLWLSDGWEFIQSTNIQAPLYWHKVDGEWWSYNLSGFQPVNPDLPVQHISLYEAMAYAEWAGARLPTEFEREVASDRVMAGQLWEWTNSAYLPYPGFSKAPGALGEYNGKFMVNQHVLRGSSIATPEGHSRSTYRNFFNPSSRWVFSGIRLAK